MDDLPTRGPPFDPAVPGPPELLLFSTSYTVKRKAHTRESQMIHIFSVRTGSCIPQLSYERWRENPIVGRTKLGLSHIQRACPGCSNTLLPSHRTWKQHLRPSHQFVSAIRTTQEPTLIDGAAIYLYENTSFSALPFFTLLRVISASHHFLSYSLGPSSAVMRFDHSSTTIHSLLRVTSWF